MNRERNFSYFTNAPPGTIMRLKIADHIYSTAESLKDISHREPNILINYEKFPLHSIPRLPSDFTPKMGLNPQRKSNSSTSLIPNTAPRCQATGMGCEKKTRYSIGDYLRHQILEDLSSPEILAKSDEAIAFDRYHRVRAYLDDNPRRWTSSHPSDDNDSDIPRDKPRRIRRRYSENRRNARESYRPRKSRSDANVRLNSPALVEKVPRERRSYRRTRSDLSQGSINSDGSDCWRDERRSSVGRSISCGARDWIPRTARIGECLAERDDDGEDAGAAGKGEPLGDGEDLSTEAETILQENYLIVVPQRKDIQDNSVSRGVGGVEERGALEFPVNFNVKKRDNSRIVNGGGGREGDAGDDDDGDGWGMGNANGSQETERDMAGDYFRRVYDLLKCRQVGKRREDKSCDPWRSGESSSSDIAEVTGRRRRRRRRRDWGRGEGVVISPGAQDTWHHQINNSQVDENDDPNYLSFCRPQLRDLSDNRRRPPPPPIPAKYKINARDISKYFNYPNKENSPGYVVVDGRIDTDVDKMGSNLSRHSEKGLTGRRTQSSGNLCDPKGKLNHVGKILVPCSSGPQERYKISGSLPNNLDDQESLEDDPIDNNNVISDTMSGNLGGTLPHKKRIHGVHFSDSPVQALDLVRYRSQDSLDGNPWRYQQDSDLDLVRCKHGNFDLVRKNQSVDTVDSGVRYSRVYDDRYHNNHLDLVGTLPKRRIDPKWCDPSRIQAFQQQSNNPDGELLMNVVHKPECELMKHRQFDRLTDIKTSRLGGEPQDQGYASERSPEDEHPPSLPGQPILRIVPESTFRVTLQKSSCGLGLSVSGGGSAGPVRVKRLFPQQPAALSNKLQPGDILLSANGVPLTDLTNYEALEVLRTTSSTVELLVCRLPGDEQNISPPGAPPPPPARREPPPPLRLLNPLPPLQIEPCGEFDIEMTKVGGSLGFTLRKVDSSALGHYVRALVREPALSDGRIQPGDKIVAVDGAPLSPMSHEEAVALVRQCGPRVKLRLYRDLAQTPVSALSPTEPDHPLRPPRTSLRQEAMDMLCDLAVRKLSPGTSNGSRSQQPSGASTNSPRKLRRPASRTPTGERDNEPIYSSNQVSTGSQIDTSDSDQCSIKTQIAKGSIPDDIIDPPALYDATDSFDSGKPLRPSFLNLGAPLEKPNYQFSLESEHEETIIIPEGSKNPIDYIEELHRDITQDNTLPSEPVSMPPIMSSVKTDSEAFSYKNPAYQSANPTCGGGDNGSAKCKIAHSSDQDIPGKVLSGEDPGGSKGLLKWKGVMFAPHDEDEGDMAESTEREKMREESLQREGYDVFMVELTRGWNSRLGFSLQADVNGTAISMVHPDSVAAKDGRLKQGDVLIMVNDESVEEMPTAEIIDLLRKIRGSIGITVARKKRDGT
ncbi:uncharacterized protein LOC135169289 [Diachasmimorpha longicaudata]|uniref:uncharacterized protein LOC135169289 n=1 Tax=Diachasmimorpha longicaudata TaxID=58733 RepID=UPI0030B893E4